MLNLSAACSIFLLALPLAAQTDDAKPASIEGVVKDSVSGAPIPRAHVTLEPRQYSAIASAEGKFAIGGITPGQYKLSAQRPGFVTGHNEFRIALGAGETKADAEIALEPTGGIAGRVTDEDGQPMDSAQVQVQNGPGTTASRITDENGQFRMGGLAPGRYRVRASPANVWSGRPEIRTDGTVEHHDVTTYYPGVVAPEAAGSVVVRPGADTQGIDIRLMRVPFVRVSGKVTGIPPGTQNAAVNASTRDGGDNAFIDPDGSFEFWRLNPGRYALDAEWKAPNGERADTGRIEIEVGDANIDNIELHSVPPSDIAGHLEYEDDAVKELVRGYLPGPLAELFQTGAESYSLDQPQVAVDGTFRLDKLQSRRYWLGFAADKFYVKSMRLGSTQIDGAFLDLSNGSGAADLTLVVSAATGVVTGTLHDDKGSTAGTQVVLVEAGEETGFDARRVTAGADGTYTIPNLPPGNYKLVATSEDNPTIADNDVFGYENQMEAVTVGVGEKVMKDLRRRTPE